MSLSAIQAIGFGPAVQAAQTSSKVGDAALTANQKVALARLHSAAQQLEGVFVGMLFKEMRSSVPQDPLFGNSNTNQIFTEMLDEQRASSMASSQSLGIASMIEGQLKQSVLDNAGHDAKVNVPVEGIL